ncbi:hypothetical protein SAMN05421874_102567 [Nonomuraea maritima]|uniref:Secreted protein n=1 Tax=Nonomuraea maritima TaxID=683260 RepID=A0A1G8VGJ9_9ACTN|nr:hypothetical protein [Nonomuraea maritima]SDJ65202.1 hypothetical protein SAMN05421874_102567 [Nonomuraea maritima]
MYKHGLVLAGVVGGMVMFSGSALASATNWPQDHHDRQHDVLIYQNCGEDCSIGGRHGYSAEDLEDLNALGEEGLLGSLLEGALGAL